MRYSGGILWYSRTFDEYGAHTLPHARILVYSCAFLMYSVEYGQFWEMCRIRVEYGSNTVEYVYSDNKKGFCDNQKGLTRDREG